MSDLIDRQATIDAEGLEEEMAFTSLSTGKKLWNNEGAERRTDD